MVQTYGPFLAASLQDRDADADADADADGARCRGSAARGGVARARRGAGAGRRGVAAALTPAMVQTYGPPVGSTASPAVADGRAGL
jgi:hypothetical protein